MLRRVLVRSAVTVSVRGSGSLHSRRCGQRPELLIELQMIAAD